MHAWGEVARQLRHLARGIGGWLERLRGRRLRPAEESVAFTVAVISLTAKMARADGSVSRAEREVFARLFDVPARERRNLERLFDLAAASVRGFEAHARRIARLFRHQPRMLEDVLEALFHIATADGVVHAAEMRFLERVAEIFRLHHRFRCIRARFVRHSDDAPYEVLGVNPCDSDEDIRLAYRRLVREYHPDRLQARSVAPEMIRLANARMAAINAAWRAIRAERARAQGRGVTGHRQARALPPMRGRGW
jgi:DnaJ like chaperone protein